MGEASNKHNQHVLTILEAIKNASKDLKANPVSFTYNPPHSATIKSLLRLKNDANSILSAYPSLHQLSHLLNSLKALLEKLENSQGYGLWSFLRRQLTYYEASRVAGSIVKEIKAWVDHESLRNLVKAIESGDEDEIIQVLKEFQTRVSQGFDRDLQDLILRTKIFTFVESILCDSQRSVRIREESAAAILALVRFNKDVFVGLVLMGPTIRALISISSCRTLEVISSLIRLMKSPLIDIIESNGEIPNIIALLSSPDSFIQVAAMDCILEIGYFGRKEAIEALLEHGLIEKLMELQRSETGGGGCEDGETILDPERRDFSSCVARFAVQLEVGEGLRQREKREFKLEVLKRVRKSAVSEAEAATVAAEVLWGSSP